MNDMQTVLIAFGITLLAGLSTGIGSLLALYTKKTNKTFLCVSLGFSAGVMIYVSFVEIFAQSNTILTSVHGAKVGMLYTTIAFFVGMGVIALIDKLVPSSENPHEIRDIEDMNEQESNSLMRMGLFTALAIGIHNFPEGIATFTAVLSDVQLGIGIAIAIAIHNIPEGIAVSVPIYFATGDKKKAFKYSFLSGLSEPIGAIIGYLILRPFLTDTLFGLIFAGVAGIMVYISFDELLPTARKYGQHHLTIYGLIAGMGVMAASLILFAT